MTKKEAPMSPGGKKKAGKSKRGCAEVTAWIKKRKMPGKPRTSMLGRRTSMWGSSAV